MAVPVGAKIANGPSSAPEEKREQFRSAFLNVAPSMFLGALDQTIIAAVLPAIAGSLGGLSYLAWVVTGYLLAATVAAPLYGRMGDAYGRKRCCSGRSVCSWRVPLRVRLPPPLPF